MYVFIAKFSESGIIFKMYSIMDKI